MSSATRHELVSLSIIVVLYYALWISATGTHVSVQTVRPLTHLAKTFTQSQVQFLLFPPPAEGTHTIDAQFQSVLLAIISAFFPLRAIFCSIKATWFIPVGRNCSRSASPFSKPVFLDLLRHHDWFKYRLCARHYHVSTWSFQCEIQYWVSYRASL